MTEHKSARELFQAAYENRYTWDKNFPGYSADIEIKQGLCFNNMSEHLCSSLFPLKLSGILGIDLNLRISWIR